MNTQEAWKAAYRTVLVAALTLLLAVCAAGCSASGRTADEPTTVAGMEAESISQDNEETMPVSAEAPSYHQISQPEAAEMMEQDDGHVIVDVRRRDEYDAGHIPGAILIPNEEIGAERPEALPDLDQVILIYCRSGNRSRQAAEKLAAMGYTHIYEFGGIKTGPGEIVTGEATAETAEGGAMRMRIGETEVPVTWEDNASVEALRALLPLEIPMSMYGGFEQVGPIGQSITRQDEQITTSFGDIVLYSGDQIVVFYGSNSWAYTRLGHVNLPQEELTDLLGSADVTITITEG